MLTDNRWCDYRLILDLPTPGERGGNLSNYEGYKLLFIAVNIFCYPYTHSFALCFRHFYLPTNVCFFVSGTNWTSKEWNTTIVQIQGCPGWVVSVFILYPCLICLSMLGLVQSFIHQGTVGLELTTPFPQSSPKYIYIYGVHYGNILIKKTPWVQENH